MEGNYFSKRKNIRIISHGRILQNFSKLLGQEGLCPCTIVNVKIKENGLTLWYWLLLLHCSFGSSRVSRLRVFPCSFSEVPSQGVQELKLLLTLTVQNRSVTPLLCLLSRLCHFFQRETLALFFFS